MVARIEVKGLREFQASLRKMDRDLPKQLRIALNLASDEVIDYAAARFPKRSGRAAGSLKGKSSQREARVSLGGRRAPYAAWLDFGGQGRVAGRPAPRPFIRDGRYVYAGLDARRERITQILEETMTQLARDAGLDVS